MVIANIEKTFHQDQLYAYAISVVKKIQKPTESEIWKYKKAGIGLEKTRLVFKSILTTINCHVIQLNKRS